VIKGNDNEMNGERLNVDDIFPLEISNKSKAKLLSKLTGESVKDWYDRLNRQKA
jgi:16S rRNA (cytidine1402-2'-O)-methyltransferase